MQKNQTAIAWLIDNLPIRFRNALINSCAKEIEEAKEIDRKAIAMAWHDGNMLGRNGWVLEEYSTGEGYYENTYDSSQGQSHEGYYNNTYDQGHSQGQNVLDSENEKRSTGSRTLSAEEREKILIEIMQKDEELGLYDEPENK